MNKIQEAIQAAFKEKYKYFDIIFWATVFPRDYARGRPDFYGTGACPYIYFKYTSSVPVRK